MDDTPDYIKKLQLETWLSKTPAERLRQFLIDNDTLMQFWRNAARNRSQDPSVGIKTFVENTAQ